MRSPSGRSPRAGRDGRLGQLDRAAAVPLVELDDDRVEHVADVRLEHGGLDRRDDSGLVLLRAAVRPLHRLRELRQRLANPVAARRGRRRRRGRPRSRSGRQGGGAALSHGRTARRRPRAPARPAVAVEGRVARATQEHGRLREERGMLRVGLGRASGSRRRRHGFRPVDAERLRRAPQPGDRPASALGQCPQDPDVRVQHQLRRRLAGHQRDLRIPPLDREQGPERGARSRAWPLSTVLLGDPQVDSAEPLVSRCWRRGPTSRRSCSDSLAVPSSSERWTPA